MRRRCILPLLALGFLAPLVAAAQGEPTVLTGVVRDEDGTPLPRAQVVAADGGRGAVSDGEGRFVLRGLRPGPQRLSVSLVGYAPESREVTIPAADSRGLGVFGFQELAAREGGPALQLGARLDEYAIASRPSAKFGAGRARSFRALSGSVELRLPLNASVAAGVNLARSFRAPTVEELFSAAPHAGTGAVEFGSPGLRAERGRALEAVLQIRSARWNGQMAAFHNAIADYVHLAARGDTVIDRATLPVFVYAQGDATLRGVEGQLEWAARRDLVLGASGDLLHAAQRDGTPLSFMPPARLGALLRWDDGTFSLSGDVHHEFRQGRVGAAAERPTEAHTVFRALAGVR